MSDPFREDRMNRFYRFVEGDEGGWPTLTIILLLCAIIILLVLK